MRFSLLLLACVSVVVGCGSTGSREPSAVKNLTVEEQRQRYGQNVPIYTADELALHRAKVPEFAKISSECVRDHLEEHRAFHEKYGASNYIGVNTRVISGGRQVPLKSVWKEGEDKGKLRSIVARSYADWKSPYKKKARIANEDLGKVDNMSCIGMAITCMRTAFEKTGQAELYKKLIEYYRNPGVRGIQAYTGHPLMMGLRQLGWKIGYWNPNTSSESLTWMDTAEGDPARSARHHAQRFSEVTKQGTYNGIPVDFRVTDTEAWGSDRRDTPAALKNSPFGIFESTDFYHVGPFSYGQITEAHAGMMWYAQNGSAGDYEKSKRVIESNPFSPFASGGAPRGHYPTGIVAIPPQ